MPAISCEALVKKRRTTKKNTASIVRGNIRALAKRGIKIDKRGRARKDGKPLAKTKLERAVSAIERARKRPTAAKKPAKKAAEPKAATKRKAAPKAPKELSERDAFIIESLAKNHLTPEVRKRYIKNLSPRARAMVEELPIREEEKILEDAWRKADMLLVQAIRNKSFYMEWEVIAATLKLPPQEIFERGLRLAGAKPSTFKVAWHNWQRAEQLIREALARGTFQGEYERIAAATGLTAREIYSLGISPPSLGTAA